MGSRFIYTCPRCRDEIYIGGGINEGERVICPQCKSRFKLEHILREYEPEVHCRREITVREVPEDMILVTDSQNIKDIVDYFDNPEWMDYGCYFVRVEDGEYALVYGCNNSIPHYEDWLDRIWME